MKTEIVFTVDGDAGNSHPSFFDVFKAGNPRSTSGYFPDTFLRYAIPEDRLFMEITLFWNH